MISLLTLLGMGNMLNKDVLVVQGGGARGTYAAGVLKILLENGFHFDEVYGTSAGALLGIEYLTKDVDRLEKLIQELSSAKGFIKVQNYFTKGSIFDFNYLLQELPKEKLPFKEEEFFNSQDEFYAVSACVNDNHVAYFSKNDPNFYSGLASSASLPPFSKPIMIDGKGYVDGGIFEAVPFLRPLEEDAKHIVVVSTREKGFRKKSSSKAIKALYRKQYRKNKDFLNSLLNDYKLYNEQMDLMDKLHDEGRIFVIYPSLPPTVKVTTQDKEKLHALFVTAEEDTKNSLTSLKEYLSK